MITIRQIIHIAILHNETQLIAWNFAFIKEQTKRAVADTAIIHNSTNG